MINLLSLQKKTETKTILLSRFLNILFFTLSFAFIVLILTLVPIYFYLEQQSKDAETLLGNLAQNDKYGQVKNSLELINDANKKAKAFPNEMPINSRIENIINKIVALKDSGIKIKSFKYAGGDSDVQSIEISGVATDRKALLGFKERLGAQEGFSNVTLPISSFVRVENIDFVITLKSK